MNVAAVLRDFDPHYGALVPWLFHRRQLAARGVRLEVLDAAEAFTRRHDAMIPMVWLDWDNPRRFAADRIMPFLEQYSAYRARYPDVVQIICNHIDMARRPYALPYWRKGDPILYRTPPYDRKEIEPLPEEDVWAYECIMGSACLVSDEPPRYPAGFIGTPSGPAGYRARVALETARVGVGLCAPRPISQARYRELLSACEIVVCPRGWGGQSLRHWDAWKSGKPVLTDGECAALEMIPGVRLVDGVHYLVFHDPTEIPDIVADWTRPSRRDDLRAIAENGRRAACSYDGLESMTRFFHRVAAALHASGGDDVS
jgi:hypothetical protein